MKEQNEKIWMKASGRFLVTEDSIRVVLHPDFCKFYGWLYKKATYNTQKISPPKHGAHINLVSPKIHKGVDCGAYLHLNGAKVDFFYDIGGNFGGFSKGFKNFWLDVKGKVLYKILDNLGIKQKKHEIGRFARLHITIFNTKNL